MIAYFSGKPGKKLWLFLCVFLISGAVYSQEAPPPPVPDTLRMPDRGEAPRYPKDVVIGELGRGEAPGEAYALAQRILQALTAGRKNAPALADSPSLFTESVFEEIRGISPRGFRLGGGRIEPDGCVSFIVRFIGRTESITGELFFRRAEAEEPEEPGAAGAGQWLPDDLSLETRRPIAEIRDTYRYNFSPYERFY